MFWTLSLQQNRVVNRLMLLIQLTVIYVGYCRSTQPSILHGMVNEVNEPCISNGGVRNFHLGAIAKGPGPGRSFGRRSSPRSYGAVCRNCSHILTAETNKIKKCCTTHLLISWPVYFAVGAKWHFLGLSPLVHGWHCQCVLVNRDDDKCHHLNHYN